LIGCYLFDKQPNFIPTKEISNLYPAGSEIAKSNIRRRRAAIQATFLDHKDPFKLNEEIVGLLIDLQTLTSMTYALDVSSPEAHVASFVSARISLEYRILQMTGQHDLNNFGKAVCLAGQIYVNRVLRVFTKGDMIPHWIAERLKHIVMSAFGDTIQSEDLPDAMLWVAFMGALGAKTGPLMDWFVDLIYFASSALGIQSWSQVQPRLETWSWSEERLGEEYRSIWEEVEAKVVMQSWAQSIVVSPF
jgi:hypothetical protein